MADEFDEEFGHLAPAEGEDDEFDREFADVLPVPEAEPAPQPEMTGLDRLLDMAKRGGLGLGEGASLGHGENLGRLGASIGDSVYNAVNGPSPTSNPLGTRRGGMGSGEGAAQDVAGAVQTPMGKTGRALGALATSVATGSVAAPTIAGQAGAGAVLGGLQAHGDHGLDPGAILSGAAGGGALGAAGGAVGKALGGLSGPAMRGGLPSTGTRMGQAAEALSALVPGKYGPVANKALEPGLELLAKLAPGAARGLGNVAATTGGGALGDLMGSSKASAQDAPPSSQGPMRTAPFGTQPESRTTRAEVGRPEIMRAEIGRPQIDRWSVQAGDAQVQPEWGVNIGQAREAGAGPQAAQTWAVQSVLYQGDSGLPPEAEQQLTEAVMSGDEEKLATANFLMSGKYPRFASALQKQMQTLSREED